MQALQGAWVALVTPFTRENRVNVPVLRDLTRYLLGKEVDGFYLCGSTGEGLYQSVAERKQVTETVLEQVAGRVPVIVQVGCVALCDAVDLAQHAAQAGAAGISSILPPRYHDARSLYDYFERLAGAASGLPVLPYLFGGPTDAVSLMRELRRIPGVRGTKYTGPNMFELRRIIELADTDWAVFSGMDEQCAFATMWGASGSIGSTPNVMPGVYRRIRRACREGDLAGALALQAQANKLTELLLRFSFPGALRETLAVLGFDCGKPRLPDRDLTEEERQVLRGELEGAGLRALAEM